MKYDDAGWHSGGEFPADSPPELGGTHIALMLKWCFLKGWAGPWHTSDNQEEMARMLRGELGATDYLFDWCDGKLTDEDLDAAGNAFMLRYYAEGPYLEDYERHFRSEMYRAPEAGHDFDRYSRMVEARCQSFLGSHPEAPVDPGEPPPVPWWKFW